MSGITSNPSYEGEPKRGPRITSDQYRLRILNFLYFDKNTEDRLHESTDNKGNYIGAIQNRIKQYVGIPDSDSKTFSQSMMVLLNIGLVKKDKAKTNAKKQLKDYYLITNDGEKTFELIRELVGKPIRENSEITQPHPLSQILQSFRDMDTSFTRYV